MATVDISLLGGFVASVDGVTLADDRWSRRAAANLVKLLALAPGRSLHRELVIDALWPDDPIDRAAPKLHKAAHYVRRAFDRSDAVVLRDERVMLFPDIDVSVDVVRFEALAARAIADRDAVSAQAAVDLYGGDLLPHDLYELWSEARRDLLRLRHVDLLRLLERWEAVVELEPTDELAHVALMRRFAADGDRHAALRQFERMERALRGELGVAPGPDAVELRDRLLGDHDLVPRRPERLVGRDRELGVLRHALDDAAGGRGTVVIVSGAAGMGKSVLLSATTDRARELGFGIGRGVTATVEGSWAFAPVLEALADLCRQRPALLDDLDPRDRDELRQALSGRDVSWSGDGSHQRLFVAALQLVRAAARSSGVLLVVDDLQDADDGSLRILHHLARSTYEDRVCLVLAHRPTPPGSALEEVRRSLLARHQATEVLAGPLTPDQIDVLVHRVAPDAPDEVLRSIEAFSGGSPFAVTELARRAALHPGWMITLDADILGGVEPATKDALQRVAVIGGSFDTDEFVAVSGLEDGDAYDRLDDALAAGVLTPTGTGYRFRHGIVRNGLVDALPPHRLRLAHRDAADRLTSIDASPARIGHHLLQGGAATEAVPYLLRAAETEAGLGAYRDALDLVDHVLPHVAGRDRVWALRLRGDLLRAVGDPGAVAAYRMGLELADGSAARQLRVRLARGALMGGDLPTAEAALQGLEPDGGPDDADLLLIRGELAFFAADIEGAQAAADAAQALVMAGDRNWRVLDLVTLQGLLSHGNGEWSDLMKVELTRTKESPELANAVFDGYLCAAEYMVYGPTPHAEIIAVGQDLQATAERSGALRAAAFGAALVGEGALLSGDLVLAEGALGEARDMHHGLGAFAGEAIALHGLAELRITEGRHDEAAELLERALVLGRSSIVARHLVQRLFGGLVRATSDPDHARAVVDRAEASLGWDDSCLFCGLMFEVPAAMACIHVDDLVEADRHIAAAEACTAVWGGTSWDAALDEVRAARLAAVGDIDGAIALLAAAEAGFLALQHPIEAARCRETAELLVA